MFNIILREKALRLRKQNRSYSQIKKELNIPKSTLSTWLKEYPLPKSVISELRDNNEIRIERFRQTMASKKEKRLNSVYQQEKAQIKKLTMRETMFTGIALYWGEGTKAGCSKVAITNTDPKVLKFFILWLNLVHRIKKTQLKVALHLYEDMETEKETKYWSKVLDIPTRQFNKPYIKKTSSTRINHKGSFGHGTCIIAYYSVELKQKIMMQIKLLTEIC